MNLVIDHLEYLLRRHDCVTVPGIGALMVRYRPARFDSRNPLVLLPPSRELAFNGALVESDGMLESSVARRNGVSFEAASRIVEEETESLLEQLKKFGTIALGRLGELNFSEYGTIVFSPFDASGWDFSHYGLRPLYLKGADSMLKASHMAAVSAVAGNAAAPSAPHKHNELPPPAPWGEEEEAAPVKDSRGVVAKGLVGIAASLAVIVTLALFFLNPVKVENEPVKASIAPTEVAETNSMETAEAPAAEYADDVDPAWNMIDASRSESIPAEAGVADTAEALPAATEAAENRLPSGGVETSRRQIRFDDADPFCVIVASFPEESQATRYIAENPGRVLGVLQQDGKYRVYAATGATYEEAAAQKSISDGAWICRR